ncbi:MAG: lytic transglycosylase domain-containing protein [Thermodesulfobacteriota bacterium]
MGMKIFLLAIIFSILALPTVAAAAPRTAADGSLVLEVKESAGKPNSGDTLYDLQTLGTEVQAYIFHNRTRVWSPNFILQNRRSAWKPLSNPQLESLIHKYSRHYGVDPALIRAVMRHESGFNTQAVSPKGAQGLMQLMPGTAALMGVRDPFDPEQNIAGGVGYLRRCLDRFGNNVPLAVAAYNAGPEAVARHCSVPPYSETQTFVQNVLGSYGSSGLPRANYPGLAAAKAAASQQVAKPPRRTKGPKVIELTPRKKSRPRVAQNTGE